jgi:hypothetical protein
MIHVLHFHCCYINLLQISINNNQISLVDLTQVLHNHPCKSSANEVKNANYFSSTADLTSDVRNVDHLS